MESLLSLVLVQLLCDNKQLNCMQKPTGMRVACELDIGFYC